MPPSSDDDGDDPPSRDSTVDYNSPGDDGDADGDADADADAGTNESGGGGGAAGSAAAVRFGDGLQAALRERSDRAKRRSCCGRVVHLVCGLGCFALTLVLPLGYALLVMAPPVSAALRVSDLQRIVLRTNWAVCDRAVSPACQLRCTAFESEPGALAHSVVARLSATSEHVARALDRINATRLVEWWPAGDGGPHARVRGARGLCAAAGGVPALGVPVATATVFGPAPMCDRFKARCDGLGYELGAAGRGAASAARRWMEPPRA